MASVDALEAFCEQWLNDRRGALSLQRTLYLVPGLDDERAGCWLGPEDTIEQWGKQTFSNWRLVTNETVGSPEWKQATVKVIKFPSQYPPPPLDTFLQFGAILRAAIHNDYPDRGSPMGEYDLVGHSMGGLDAFVALLDLDVKPGPAPDRIANAYNFATLDTPFRGVPNMNIRRKSSPPKSQNQCTALTPGSAELALVESAVPAIEGRVTRVTCYGVDTATQVEVTSHDLYADRQMHAAAIRDADYRFIQIPGASHSGGMGITTSVITIANLFDTLTRGDRVSDWK